MTDSNRVHDKLKCNYLVYNGLRVDFYNTMFNTLFKSKKMTNKKLINTYIKVDDEEDKKKIKKACQKITEEGIPLSELKALTCLFQSLCKYADLESK